MPPKKVKKDSSLPVVLPIREDDGDRELNESIHPNLPKAPSVICIYASFRSGKSVLVNNFFLNPNFLRGKLDKVYYYSPTARNDASCKFLQDEEGVEIIDDYTDDHLNALLDFQMETPKKTEIKSPLFLMMLYNTYTPENRRVISSLHDFVIIILNIYFMFHNLLGH
tara:strand:+ start:494 stop:994 length:501 start_codon:yes stop_codon:yes gene_type:complete